MIRIEKVETLGWEPAIRGMRNPMNSWANSDSHYEDGTYIIGEKDAERMTQLANAGTDHGKFLRMITVFMDVTAPFYWWKEYDTYKVGTIANSCSTMHKLMAKEFELEDFSTDKLNADSKGLLKEIIRYLNHQREIYLNGINGQMKGDKEFWWQIIQLLPASYNQKRTLELNYAVLRNIYQARKNHKLDEWREFCQMIEGLPMAEELIIGGKPE